MINGSKKNSKYENWHFKSNNNYDYIFKCDKVEVIVSLYVKLICKVFESNCYVC